MIDFSRLLDPIKRQIRLVVGKALIQSITSSKDGLFATIGMANDEKHEDVPFMQQYGIVSVPNSDSKAVVLFIGGARDNGIVVATQGDASSIPKLEKGEVCLYSEFGQTIVLKKDGSILAAPKSGKSFRIEGQLDVIGKIVSTDEVAANYADLNGTLIPSVTSVHLSTHVHYSTAPGDPTSPPNPGT